MVQILILEWRHEKIKELRGLLEPKHKLVFVDSVAKAVSAANPEVFDLFMSALHLPEGEKTGSTFDFLRSVKINPTTKSVPFFFCCIRPSHLTQTMADSLKRTAQALGADHFELVTSENLSNRLLQGVDAAIECARQRKNGGKE